MQEMIVMGRIVAPYGVLGWIKVLPDTEMLDGLKAYPNWSIGKATKWQQYRLDKLKVHNDVLLVKLDGVDDRDKAFALKGSQVAVPKAELPAPLSDEYYWVDLIGLTVSNEQGVVFGKVADVFETGANDVLVVREVLVDGAKTDKDSKHKERLIPFVDQVIKTVDLSAQTMLVDWDESY